MPQTIAITGDKGGTGKSTISILLAEWCMHRGKNAHLIDADPNQTTQVFLDKCANLSYHPSVTNAPITIIDTAGTSGASLQRHIINATHIVLPCQPHVADLEQVIGWYLSVNHDLQERVVFVPNRLINTVEQRRGLGALEDVVKNQGRGRIAPGLANRPAVYPPLLNGRAENYFQTVSGQPILDEIEATFDMILRGSYE